jgi:hypothetical protein
MESLNSTKDTVVLHDKFNILMSNNYFILKIACQNIKYFRRFYKIFKFPLEKNCSLIFIFIWKFLPHLKNYNQLWLREIQGLESCAIGHCSYTMKPCIVLSMFPNSLFQPFHHQNAPFFLLKIEKYFNIDNFLKRSWNWENACLQQNVWKPLI